MLYKHVSGSIIFGNYTVLCLLFPGSFGYTIKFENRIDLDRWLKNNHLSVAILNN